MSAADSQPAAQASVQPSPQPAEQPASLVGVPLPADLVQADPAILVDSVRGSGTPQNARTFRHS
jgi:hypothetical protein